MRASRVIVRVVPLVVVGAMAFGACGQTASMVASHRSLMPASAPSMPPPGDPNLSGVVIQYSVQGMFPVVPPFMPDGPKAVIYADGTVIVPETAAAVVAPTVWPYRIGHVDPAEVVTLVATAEADGLLGEPVAYPIPLGVADPPRTSVELTTGAGMFSHVVDGLGLGSAADPQSDALQSFISQVIAMTFGVATVPYAATRVAIAASAVEAGDPAPSTVIAWPSTGLSLTAATAAGGACTIVDDPATVRLLASTTRGTGFSQAGVVFRLAASVAAPGSRC